MTRRMPDPPGLDVAQLEAYLRREHPDVVGDGTLSARVIAGGRSNLTYRVDGGPRPLVVRRPPLGHVQTTAHDMAREHRVISALQGSRVPVPPAVALVDDPTAGTGGVVLRHGPRRGHRARPPVAEHRPTPPTSCAP